MPPKSKESGTFLPAEFYRIVNPDHGDVSTGSIPVMRKLSMTDETNLNTPTTKRQRPKLSKSFTIAESEDVPDIRECPVVLHGIRRLSLTIIPNYLKFR